MPFVKEICQFKKNVNVIFKEHYFYWKVFVNVSAFVYAYMCVCNTHVCI